VVRVVVAGHDLPGRTFRTGDDEHRNVHVGLQVRREPTALVPADALDATWELDVEVRADDEHGLDFRGPAVQGKRGERFLYLTWGDLDDGGGFHMFRRAKLMLHRVDPSMVRAANRAGRTLVASVDLTDEHGCPRCARVDPPAITWTVR